MAAAPSEGQEIKTSCLPSVVRSSGQIDREINKEMESIGKQAAATATRQLLGGRGGRAASPIAALSEARGSLIIPAHS